MSRGSGCNAGPKSHGSGYNAGLICLGFELVGLAATPDLRAMDLATTPDSYALVSNAWLKCLWPGSATRLKGFESALLPLPNNLNQVPLFSSKFLGSERGCQTQVNNNNNNNNNNWFYLSNQIFIFFYSDNIYCKFNNINEFNNVYNINNNI
jgi:hypothetical protein